MSYISRRQLIGGGLLYLLERKIVTADEYPYEPARVKESLLETAIKLEKPLITIDDVDTITYEGEPVNGQIRFAGVEGPETKNRVWKDQKGKGKYRKHNCAQTAKNYTKEKIEQAKKILYVPAGTGKLGRKLGYIIIDNELLQYHLVMEGLVYPVIEIYGDNGHPELAKKIQIAKKRRTKKPHFENPKQWRRRQFAKFWKR